MTKSLLFTLFLCICFLAISNGEYTFRAGKKWLHRKEFMDLPHWMKLVGVTHNDTHVQFMTNTTIYVSMGINKWQVLKEMPKGTWIQRVEKNVMVLKEDNLLKLAQWRPTWESLYQTPSHSWIDFFNQDGDWLQRVLSPVQSQHHDDIVVLDEQYWVVRYRLNDNQHTFKLIEADQPSRQLTPIISQLPTTDKAFFAQKLGTDIYIVAYCDADQMKALSSLYKESPSIHDEYSRYVIFKYDTTNPNGTIIKALDPNLYSVASMSIDSKCKDHVCAIAFTFLHQNEMIQFDWQQEQVILQKKMVLIEKKQTHHLTKVDHHSYAGDNHTAWFTGKNQEVDKWSMFLVDLGYERVVLQTFFDFPILALSNIRFNGVHAVFYMATGDSSIYEVAYTYDRAKILPMMAWQWIVVSLVVLFAVSVLVIGCGTAAGCVERAIKKQRKKWNSQGEYEEVG